MIRCPKQGCKSLGKVVNLNFAKLKREGEPADKSELLDEEGYCHVCGHSWTFDPEAEKLYFEYKELIPKTTIIAQTVKPGEPYQVQHIRPHELSRRLEIAKILAENHQHNLDVSANEWFKIIRDAS